MTILSALALTGCGVKTSESGNIPSETGKKSSVSQQTGKINGITMRKEGVVCETVSVGAGYTVQLSAEVNATGNPDKTISWETSNPKIATVDTNGLVTGVDFGDCEISAKIGKIKASCKVSVTDYHRSSSVFENITRLANNPYNTQNGLADYVIDCSSEDYVTVKFDRGATDKWASIILNYDAKIYDYTDFQLGVELVSGNLSTFGVEFQGTNEFKSFYNVSLEQGKEAVLNVPLTDYIIEDSGSWSSIALEFNNPTDDNDSNRKENENVELRIKKAKLVKGEKKAPGKVEGLKFDETLQKLSFKKVIGATEYKVEATKDGSPLELDTAYTRFASITEPMTDIRTVFTPKKTKDINQNFAEIKGVYTFQITAKNSVGFGTPSEKITVKIDQNASEEKSGFTCVGFTDGTISPNQWNRDKESYSAEKKEDGYHLKFTGNDGHVWDSFTANFGTAQAFKHFKMKFSVLKGNPVEAVAELAGATDEGKQQHSFTITEGENVVAFDITCDTTKGYGLLSLQFGHSGAACGETEILLTDLEITE